MRSIVGSGVFHLGQAMLDANASLRAIVSRVSPLPFDGYANTVNFADL
jgi:hypothetical protein